ncbi:hypothetical protein LCGC14_2352880 [marine sediment metagenome]|uniref:Uncharacterized protein n=1 Tax=marine sediment metagenome TaxID=412755 RepID=A0A0F9F3N6_9ZZZZ
MSKLSEWVVRSRFDRARLLLEKAQKRGWDVRILAQALFVLQDERA